MTSQQSFTRFGFKFGKNGVHAARTMMLAELQALFAYTAPDTSREAYREQVVELNRLDKPTSNARVLTWGHLLDLYGLSPEIPLSGGVITRPDVYFHEPNDQYEGVCIYLDGMSNHLHGNAQTAAKDRQIRQELLNTDYEVIEIQYQELFDKTVMREHMRRIARAVVGKAKAKELAGSVDWFEAASASTTAKPEAGAGS